MDDFSDLTIIIPTFNEEENIEILINFMISNYKDVNVIVSDDGSSDGTQSVVIKKSKKNSKMLLFDHSEFKSKGLTASVIDAFSLVKTKYIIVMDGDMQHPPEKIKDMINYLRSGNDIVIGSRKRRTINWQRFDRKMTSDFGTFLATLILKLRGISVSDPLSGFFGFNSKIIPNLNIRRFVFEGYKVLYDILKQVDNKKYKIHEVFFKFGFRKSGSSKMSSKHIFYFIKSIFS